MIAQEVEAVYPELVSTWGKGYKAVDYAKLSGVLVEGLNELRAETQAKLAERDAQIEALSTCLSRMETRLAALEEGMRTVTSPGKQPGAEGSWASAGLPATNPWP